jgi:hypothetical protein
MDVFAPFDPEAEDVLSLLPINILWRQAPWDEGL